MKKKSSLLNLLLSMLFAFALLSSVFLPPKISPIVASADGAGRQNTTPKLLNRAFVDTTTTVSNSTPIVIGDNTTNPNTTPYPSQITISGAVGKITNVTVTLKNLSIGRPRDLDILLVSPSGGALILISDVAGNTEPSSTTTNVTITLQDGSPSLPGDVVGTTPLVSGTFRPTNDGAGEANLPAPAPTIGVANYPPNSMDAGSTACTGCAATFASVFALPGVRANGVWSLYVDDDGGGGTPGTIAQGWTLNVTTNNDPTAAPATISGLVNDPEGKPLGGTLLTLSGAEHTQRAITDERGFYSFTDVETDGFYTVTPSRANYKFGPTERSFSLLADKTDAGFSAEALTPTKNPLETPEFFVRQHYLDFLNREPDQGGLDYWSGQLRACGDDSGCLNRQRTAISAAFFIEQEFQQTGSFIYRLYKAGLGRELTYQEFSNDRQQVVGGQNLDASRSALTDAFVRRAEFTQKYSEAKTADSFVDALIQSLRQSADADLSQQRGSLIAKYQTGADINQSRRLVIREAIEAQEFGDAVYNSSFVLAQYFGYLRRDPDEAGYRFWLDVLNTREPNNYRGMVCSFITSAEHQQRFSPIVAHSNRECGP